MFLLTGMYNGLGESLRDWKRLGVSAAVDAYDMIPGLPDVGDLATAYLQKRLWIDNQYKGDLKGIMGNLQKAYSWGSFIESILPFTDAVPSSLMAHYLAACYRANYKDDTIRVRNEDLTEPAA